MRFRLSTAVLTWILFIPGAPARAVTCDVPSAAHPTIQSAVDDASCTEVVIAAGTFEESPAIARTLAVQGAGSTLTFVRGRVEVSAGAVQLTGLHLSAGGEALVAHSGAEVSGFDLEVVNGLAEPPLFADGFESGDTSAWPVSFP